MVPVVVPDICCGLHRHVQSPHVRWVWKTVERSLLPGFLQFWNRIESDARWSLRLDLGLGVLSSTWCLGVLLLNPIAFLQLPLSLLETRNHLWVWRP